MLYAYKSMLWLHLFALGNTWYRLYMEKASHSKEMICLHTVCRTLGDIKIWQGDLYVSLESWWTKILQKVEELIVFFFKNMIFS